MMTKLMHNWHLKLLSLALAFVLWVVVINYDDPLETKTFEGIPVLKQNEAAITGQDKAVQYIEGETVVVVLRGKRTIIDKLTSADINAYADLNRVSITNAVAITVDAGEEVEILRKTPNEMLISTEDIESEVRVVQVQYSGELAKDHIKLNEIITPNQIELTGPTSKLGRVVSVIVPVEISEADDDVTSFVKPQLLDSSGNEVKGLEVSNNQIQIKVPIKKIKTVSVSIATSGELNENYRLMSMSIPVKTVTIYGEEEDLESITKLIVNNVDLSLMTDGTTSETINLATYLPEKVSLYDVAPMTAVAIDIEPIISVNRWVEQDDINVKQIPEGLQFQFIEEEPYVVSVKGIYSELLDFDTEDMLPRISLADLEPGIHEIPLQLTIGRGFELGIEEMPLVSIELTIAPVEEESTEPEEETTAAE